MHAGGMLSPKDVEIIYKAIEERRKNFPGEPEVITLSLVLQNIGRRMMTLVCEEGEWTGHPTDIPAQGSEHPLCPNGHSIMKEDEGLRLVWEVAHMYSTAE